MSNEINHIANRAIIQLCGIALMALSAIGITILLQPDVPQWADVLASPLFVLSFYLGLGFYLYKSPSQSGLPAGMATEDVEKDAAYSEAKEPRE
jgi:hypothetical protein